MMPCHLLLWNWSFLGAYLSCWSVSNVMWIVGVLENYRWKACVGSGLVDTLCETLLSRGWKYKISLRFAINLSRLARPSAFPCAAMIVLSVNGMWRTKLIPSLFFFLIFQPCNQLEFCFKGENYRNISWFVCCQPLYRDILCCLST